MRLAWVAAPTSLVVLSACFVDLTGEGGAGPGDGSTSVFMSGGGTQGAGGGPGGGGSGGGTTTTGMGGADVCGDGTVEAPESCDDGNVISGDGCTAACAPEMVASCTKDPPYLVSLGADFPPIVVTGDTTDQVDHLHLGEDASCQSDGPDQWLAVRMQNSGTVTAKLTVTDGFGGNHDHAILHVRNACPAPARPDVGAAYEGELVCKATDELPVLGTFTFDFFVRAGETYYFAVDGKGGGDQGPYQLELSQTSVCGDLTTSGMEQCDGQPGCAGCMQTTCMFGALGNGVFDQPSQRCFLGIATGKTFWNAREDCVLAGGDLVGQRSEEVDFPVFSAESWVGIADFDADDAQDDFRWMDGTADTLELPSDLDQNRLRCATRITTGAKDDRFCDNTYASICELRFANP
jgi:cysteine-rich repeat protein